MMMMGRRRTFGALDFRMLKELLFNFLLCHVFATNHKTKYFYSITDVINLLLLHKDNHHSMDENFIRQVQRDINKIDTNFTIMMTFRTKVLTDLCSFENDFTNAFTITANK